MSADTLFRAVVDADLFRRAAICVSTEETRYYLNGVYVHPCPEGGALMVATDGHRLVVIRDPEGSIEGDPQIINLNKEMLKACKAKPKAIEGGPRKLVIEGDSAKVNTQASGFPFGPPDDEGTIAYQWSAVLIDGTFPDYTKAIPNIKAPSANAPCFNGAYIHGIAMALAGSEFAGVKIVSGEDETSPALILPLSKEIDGFGVVMPMRGHDSCCVPAWALRSQPEQKQAA